MVMNYLIKAYLSKYQLPHLKIYCKKSEKETAQIIRTEDLARNSTLCVVRDDFSYETVLDVCPLCLMLCVMPSLRT